MEVDRRGARRRDRRVHRRPVHDQAAQRAARGDRVGQRPHRGEAGRRRREGAAAGQGDPRRRGRAGEAGPGAGALDTVTLEAELAEAKATRPGGRGEAGRRQGGDRQAARARSTWPTSRRRVRASWSSRAPARSASWTCARRSSRRRGRASRRRRRRCRPPTQEVEVARANAATIQTRIDDATLRVAGHRAACCTGWPSRARCWRPGGKALTLVNLEDVYMEIFLPSEAGGGREGRRRRRGSPSTTSPSARSPAPSASSRRRRSSRPSRSRPRASARS